MMLSRWQILKSSVVDESNLSNQLLFLQELCIVQPHPRHQLHVALQGALMCLIDNVVVVLLAHYRELLAVLASFFQVIMP